MLDTLDMCQGSEPCCWSVLLPCAMGRWGRPGWPLITPCFGFVSEHRTLPRHSHLPFLQRKRLKKQREWWRGGQECELLGKGEVKHRCRSQFCFIGDGISSAASDPLPRALPPLQRGKGPCGGSRANIPSLGKSVRLWDIHQHKRNQNSRRLLPGDAGSSGVCLTQSPG